MSRAGTKYRGPINPDRRLHIIAITAQVLATGQPSFFRYEGAARHGLRARFCLEGLGWRASDEVAADIVHVALNRIGAQRPTDAEASPLWTDEGWQPVSYTRCKQCSKPLEGNITEQGWHLRFCSNGCRVAYRNEHAERTQQEYWDAMKAVGELRAISRTTNCAYPECGKEFIPKKAADPRKPDALRYCSPSCSKKHYFIRVEAGELPPVKNPGGKGLKRPVVEKCCIAPGCGSRFDTRDPARVYCSKPCANRAIAEGKRVHPKREPPAPLVPRACAFCSDEFMPRTTRQIYCSETHASAAKRAKKKAMQAAKLGVVAPCAECGRNFYAPDDTFRTCSRLKCIDAWEAKVDARSAFLGPDIKPLPVTTQEPAPVSAYWCAAAE
ncbi:hypothetical protein [Mesorhizobium sp. IMUNJ 23232]|uniref:hypothetical protein n=1 Tax=Mesorhizobium sp. IMUNJ 23232 TaxID=3376064 RepID=UPI0037AC9475